jgi:hypothetical protein
LVQHLTLLQHERDGENWVSSGNARHYPTASVKLAEFYPSTDIDNFP